MRSEAFEKWRKEALKTLREKIGKYPDVAKLLHQYGLVKEFHTSFEVWLSVIYDIGFADGREVRCCNCRNKGYILKRTKKISPKEPGAAGEYLYAEEKYFTFCGCEAGRELAEKHSKALLPLEWENLLRDE